MSDNKPLVLFLKDIDRHDLPLVGGKGANLGEMLKAGFSVPNGFAVTVNSYTLFLEENFLNKKIYTSLENLDVSNSLELSRVSKYVTDLILKGEIPEMVSKDAIKAYYRLSVFLKPALVAVRSSATAEDLPTASFAGQQATYLNVRGEANLLLKVRECWASLFTPRAIFYRVENKIPHEKVKMAVLVQKMVQSEVSGVMFSIDPVSNEKDRIVIEAIWGLGEMIVQGSVVPDKYVVQKETFAILSKEVVKQAVQLIKANGETKETHVAKKRMFQQKITNEEIVKLAKLADALQEHYYFPQDIEWAREGKKLYILQTRPVTTLKDMSKGKKVKIKKGDMVIPQTPILTGTPASPGMGTGQVKVLSSSKEIEKIKRGDVLVAPMTSPDYVPAMKKAVAIVTDQGGQTSHAAIVSRELGIPCVVGTKWATRKLKDEDLVTVNGASGQIYLGSKVKVEGQDPLLTKTIKLRESVDKIKTATKLYVNLAEPERAREIAKLDIDGVGLLRAEFMIANIGIHPKEAIKTKTQDKFIQKLASDLLLFCDAFDPRPVVYRATDFKTNEYRSLVGGKHWEPEEPNPMLGYRGAFRYISTPEVFNLELQAIKKVRQRYENLWLMIPFVRSPQELEKVRRIVVSEGLFEEASFKFWMMVELPINVILFDDFVKEGIDGVSVGSNDLTMLMEGVDRDNSEVASAFDERSGGVLWALRRVIKKCQKFRITSSICGQAPSFYDDLTQKLVDWGITSISVNPDAISRVRHVIMEAERRLVK